MRVYGYEYISFLVGLIMILAKLVIIIHLSTCIFILIGLYNLYDQKGWIYQQILFNVREEDLKLEPNQSLMPYFYELYIAGIYFICTSYSTIGFGDVIPKSLIEYYSVSVFMVLFFLI